MDRVFPFIMSLLLLLVGCNSEDKYLDDDTSIVSNQIRWYGIQLPQESQTRGVANGTKLWEQKANISIKLLNLPYNRALVDSLKLAAQEWEKYCNIHFDFVRGDEDADVRIAFNWMANDWFTWSYTGTDAKTVTNQRVPTAVFGGLEYMNSKQIRGDMLRLLGQVLGLEYEQRHQLWAKNGYWKDEKQLQAYWESQFKGYYNLKWDEIRNYVFTPMTQNNTYTLYATKDIDCKSIMAWPYYSCKQANILISNNELSAGDKHFIAQLYPKKLGTIQEAWVNAGYFEWTDDTKTALWITKLGAEQEYLPDVSDGERLTNAQYLFSYIDDERLKGSKLKRMPRLNTSNVTNFSLMFESCSSLTYIPYLDTSQGTNFYNMFSGCTSLTTIPSLDLSNGRDFTYMFRDCSLLTNVPSLDTSNGITFYGMFAYCYSLTTIPLLDLSNGQDFSYMFSYCLSLIGIPPFNVSQGIYFRGMFYACISMETKPQLDLSKAKDKTDMYYGTPFSHASL